MVVVCYEYRLSQSLLLVADVIRGAHSRFCIPWVLRRQAVACCTADIVSSMRNLNFRFFLDLTVRAVILVVVIFSVLVLVCFYSVVVLLEK